jgi:hypothetical protein
MSELSVDVVTVGPSPADPYDPAAPAWALAEALARRGHSVRVVHPAGEHLRPPSAGIGTATFAPLSPHLGSARGDAELAHAARHQLRPGVDVVVRDPVRPGTLGVHHGSRLFACVRDLELEAFERRPKSAGRGVRGTLDRWREKGELRRLEATALREATLLGCATDALATTVVERYAIPKDRVVRFDAAVDVPDPLPDRAAARGIVGVPPDDPVVTIVAASAEATDASVAAARESIVRLRPIFAGAHLVLAGVEAPRGNGMVVRPDRSLENFTASIAAADVAVFLRTTPGADAGVTLAFASGAVPLVTPAVTVPAEAERCVRRLPSADPAELASALAELLADPAARRAKAEGAKEWGATNASGRVAERFEQLFGARQRA